MWLAPAIPAVLSIAFAIARDPAALESFLGAAAAAA
jgi:hypothetical protein